MKKVGMMISEISFTHMPLLMKQAGMDFIIIDCEHRPFDYKEVSTMIMNARLSKIEVFVRLSNSERKDIQKYLDMGVDGLILPMTNEAKDIEKVINLTLFSPQGQRGISNMRAHAMYNPTVLEDYMKKENNRIKVFAQIETKEGLMNISEIASVKHLHGIFIGPNDLS